MTDAQKEDIVVQLVADGYKARISTTGWLLVSGRRTTWKEGWWMAMLGWKKGTPPPKIVRTYYAPEGGCHA